MTISSPLRVVPAEVSAPEPAFRLINRTVFFSGHCEQCRPFCAAVCCTGYGFVSLTEEEAASGRYVYKEATEGCGCQTCERMRAAGIKYTLLKQADGSCMYLDGGRRCSIYADRPETCRKYNCRNIPFRLSPP
ncbi:MAG TPA: YkgJ family cysteine cluster protein [Vicinamibacterales bacterium]